MVQGSLAACCLLYTAPYQGNIVSSTHPVVEDRDSNILRHCPSGLLCLMETQFQVGPAGGSPVKHSICHSAYPLAYFPFVTFGPSC